MLNTHEQIAIHDAVVEKVKDLAKLLDSFKGGVDAKSLDLLKDWFVEAKLVGDSVTSNQLFNVCIDSCKDAKFRG
jgi:hemerythrin